MWFCSCKWQLGSMEIPTLRPTSVQSDPLNIECFLGKSDAVRVWEVTLQSARCAGKQAVCKEYQGDKRASSFQREKAALAIIARYWPDTAPRVFPLLVGWSDEMPLILTQPRVDEHRSGWFTYVMMCQLLAALVLLHGIGLIHRDIEPKHTVVLRTTAPVLTTAAVEKKLAAVLESKEAKSLGSSVEQHRAENIDRAVQLANKLAGSSPAQVGFIDVSACVALGSTSGGYSGTLCLASDDVLAALKRFDAAQASSSHGEQQGVPARKQQDLVAFVKTCYLLAVPTAMEAFHKLITDITDQPMPLVQQVEKVEEMWGQLLDESVPMGKVWRGLVRLAHVDGDGQSDCNWETYCTAVRELKEKMGIMLPGKWGTA